MKGSLFTPLEIDGLLLTGFTLIWIHTLLTGVLTISLVGSVKADCPAGDLNGDCKVNFLDISVFAEQWLEPSDTCSDANYTCLGVAEPRRADLDGVMGVNMSDFALLTKHWHQAGNPLVINEFMASNNDSVKDPQGQYDDCIEIYNSGAYAIDMAGMYLTDDPSVPTKWRIHGNYRAAIIIPPGGYLLIWADNDTTDAGLHASFKLSADGEEIALFDTEGSSLIDSVSFPKQTTDISYGRYPDAADNWRFLAVPSPAAENNGAYLGEVADTKFSHKRGFYDTPFSVTIATETKNAEIYYTLNGTEPYELILQGRSGIVHNGTVYTAPIRISQTTYLRAIAVKPGWMPSSVKTNTYLMNATEAVRSLPVVSLVGDEGTTFYELSGVMAIVGGHYGSDGKWVSDGPDSHNNPMHRGMAYERPVSFELIKPPLLGEGPSRSREDDSGFQIDCGIRVHGSDYMRPRYRRSDGLWTGNTKFSFRLYFRGRYGQSQLEYPLFPFEVESFKSIVLRGGHNDSVNPFIKDELIRRLHMDMGNVASGGTMANLFINGQYKGYFNPCEHIKDVFCQQWYQSDKEWDVMTMSGIRDGDAVAWNDFLNYARSQNLSDDTHYQYVSKQLDIPAFADYLILQLWSGNWDWPQNNWAAARERSDDGMWRFFIWDAEGGMYSDRLNTVYFDRLNTQSNANGWLYRALKVNSNFKQVFADRICKHFYNNGALTEDNIRQRFIELQDQMSGAIPNMDMYVLNTWVPNRLDIFLSACIREDMFTFRGPTFKINGLDQHGGEVPAGDTLSMYTLGRSPTFYYTLDGSDPHLLGTSQQDDDTSTTFIPENAAKLVLVPTGPTSDDWKDGQRFNDSAWLTSDGSPGGLGFSRGAEYNNLISLSLADRMYRKNATCYIRIPFIFDGSLDNFDFMTLRIRYDDGFIAYLNGIEVARRNFTGTPTWDSNAGATHSGSAAIDFEDIDISACLSVLQSGNNILAIQGLNSSATSSDFLISTELVADESIPPDESVTSSNVLRYTGPITLPHSVLIKARILRGGTWSALNEATFAVGPVADNLRITEIMYHPQSTGDSDDPNEEYIELKNVGAETVNLNLVKFTDGIGFSFPNIELAPNEYVLVVQDRSAFEARYGTGMNIAGEYSGRLNNAGERIRLEDAIGQTILDFDYGDDWRPITDGDGFSLTVIDPINIDPDSWNDKDSWCASAYLGGSPDWDDSGIIPNPGAVVINEVLAFSSAGAADWIELHNTTGEPINIGGWFLSDSGSNLTKYEIAAGTMIGPYEYVVFYEDLHFGNSRNPGCHKQFALSKNGEEAYLSSSEGGVLTGYREAEDFGASEAGVSFGRYYKPSTGNYNFVPMSENTPEQANAYPKVGPIVINEIMYNPAWPDGGLYVNDEYEYIELYNISAEPVTLYRYDKALPWKFTDGIDFTFPDDAPVTLPAGGYLLVVKNPEAFTWRYPGVPVEKILGPYSSKLSNAGERLQLSMPGDVDESGASYYIRADRVSYSDGFHPEDCPGPADCRIDLWPTEPDGGGKSLTRKVPANYGNDPDNWTASIPTPGWQIPPEPKPRYTSQKQSDSIGRVRINTEFATLITEKSFPLRFYISP